MIKLSDFNLALAAKAMGLRTVPRLRDSGNHGLASSDWYGPTIYLDMDRVRREYHPDWDAMLTVLKWDRRRPYPDFLRWVLAHEMGHKRQVQAFGADYVGDDYFERTLPLKLAYMFASTSEQKISVEREYRKVIWEADADKTADEYWHLVKFRG